MVGSVFKMELLNETIQAGEQHLVSDRCSTYVHAHALIMRFIVRPCETDKDGGEHQHRKSREEDSLPAPGG